MAAERRAKIIAHAPLCEKTQKVFTGLTYQPAASSQEICSFVSEHVTGVRKNGVDILIIDQEWDKNNGRLGTMPRRFIHAPPTTVVVTEYFEPEVQQYCYNAPLFRRTLTKMIDNYHDTKRFRFVNQVADETKKAEKTLAVADIANKPLFEVGFLLSAPNNILNFIKNKGDDVFFDKDTIYKNERTLVEIEDARRVYAAAGLEQLTREYGPRTDPVDDQNRPQIVVIYPKAHAMRIADYLIHPHPVKQVSYRGLPFLDRTVRLYQWKDTRARISGDEAHAGWERFSNRRIPNSKLSSLVLK